MTTTRCDETIRAYLKQLGQRFLCRQSAGRTWIISPYTFPDGDHIEVVVSTSPTGGLVLTDLGETLRHLADLGFDPRESDKGSYLLDRIMEQHSARLDRGMVVKAVETERLGEALQDVLMASLAVAHLVVLARGYRPATFQEEVANLLAERRIPTATRHVEQGSTGKRYAIDLFVKGTNNDALIQSLSPANPGGATAMVNATFRMWSDIPNARLRATVIDDRVLAWRDVDLRLLSKVSELYRWRIDHERLANNVSAILRTTRLPG